eukprot:scaffold18456_cov124-Isochrysis_galbana.AAC.13
MGWGWRAGAIIGHVAQANACAAAAQQQQHTDGQTATQKPLEATALAGPPTQGHRSSGAPLRSAAGKAAIRAIHLCIRLAPLPCACALFLVTLASLAGRSATSTRRALPWYSAMRRGAGSDGVPNVVAGECSAREPPLQEHVPAATSGLWTRSVHARPRVWESAVLVCTPPVRPWRCVCVCVCVGVARVGSVGLPVFCVVGGWIGHHCFYMWLLCVCAPTQ